MKLHAAALLLTLATASSAHAAQSAYPSKPIRLVVAQSAGGSADFVARTYAQHMSAQIGQQIVIDNRPGATGIVGTELVVNAPPDGYTLLLAPTSHAINPNLVAKLPYDTRRDLAAISLLGAGYNLLVVNQNNPARALRDVIAAARAQPGRLHYASSGVASATHLTTELFKLMTGTDIVHVPYKGATAGLTAVIGGESDMTFGSMPGTLPLVRAGRLRALAISSRDRSPALPDLPTVAEAGVPGFESSSWQALLGPARMPAAIVDRLYREVAQSAKNPDMVKRFDTEGMTLLATTPRELDAHIGRELEKWAKVTKAAGLSVR
ncbi:MAG: tripartite tricarboxylate transporter substrate binding protein [Burkholderiales bacterium]